MQRNFAWHYCFFKTLCKCCTLHTDGGGDLKKKTRTVRRHVWLSCNCLEGADKAWSQMCWAVFYPELFISLECHISAETWRLCSQLAGTRTDEFCLSVAKRRGSCFSLLFGCCFFSLSVFSGFVFVSLATVELETFLEKMRFIGLFFVNDAVIIKHLTGV